MAENEQAGPVYHADKALHEKLLEKVYSGNEKRLNEDFEKERANGGNTLNVLRRLANRVARRDVPGEVILSGYYLQTHQVNARPGQDEGGFSSYLLSPEKGITPIHFEKMADLPDPKSVGLDMSYGGFGVPQTWTGLKAVESLLSGSTWLTAVPNKTKFSKSTSGISQTLWELSKPFTHDSISDALGVWHGYITGFSKVKPFGETEKLSIVAGGGAAHLNVIVASDVDRTSGRFERNGIFCELTTDNQLRALLGETYNVDELQTEEAEQYLKSNLYGTPVVVFASGKTPGGTKGKYQIQDTKVSFRNGLGYIIPYSE